MRYKNNTFDKLYNQALNAKSIEEANRLFLQAEQVMMNDAPVIVLWYDEGYRLIQSFVKNFPNNPMQYRDFTEVYLERVKDSKQDL
jgi:peptide/nickel transport system substrate-binding protein